MLLSFIRGLVKKSVAFGTILTCADATVQVIEKQPKNWKKMHFDWKSLQRHGLVGSGIIGPVLYSYYFVLDKKLPGCSARTVILKTACDCVFANLVYYFLFYYSLSFLEHQSHQRAQGNIELNVWLFLLPSKVDFLKWSCT